MSNLNSLGLILLVEDHAPLLRNMAFLLQVAGFDVMTAANGEEALSALRERIPDLVISDVSMPIMDGHDLLRQVRSNSKWRKLPFIFASARYEMDDLVYGLDLGANDYIPKPFDIYDVLDTIQRVVPELITDRRHRMAG